MRMAFGLVGMLVAVGAIVLVIANFYAPHTRAVQVASQKAHEQASQIAGYGKDGGKAMDSLTLDAEVLPGGKVDNLIVTSIVPGGAMESYYGLKKDDCIIATSEMQIRGMTDPALAKDMVLHAYQRKQELTVLRNGEKIKLPLAAPPAAPQSPSGSGSGSGSDPIKSQLDAIQRMP